MIGREDCFRRPGAPGWGHADRPGPRAAACLAAALAAGPAGAGPDCTPLDLPVARTEPPPAQYAEFCARVPGACRRAGAPVMQATPALLSELDRVNRTVNAEVALVPDPDRGHEERWDLPAGCEGDCEDFALEKRRRLVAAGLPSASLGMAIVHHRTRHFAHAVLLAETSAGTFVLDNLADAPTCWSATPYRFERRERPDGRWDRYAPA